MRNDSPRPSKVDPRGRRAIIAGMLGNTVEIYDFSSYAFLVVYLAPLFFPSADPTTSVLSALAVFAAGFVARPLGGIFFGWMGDRRGRKDTLLVTVVLMGAATFLLGAIPTYASIGLWAPILLVCARILQGFSAGGEVIGSASYLAESATPGKRGRFVSAGPLGTTIGTSLAPAVVGLCTLVLGSDQMATWGWRIPFLISLPITILCLLFRLRAEESLEFETLAREKKLAASPVKEAVVGHWRAIVSTALLAMSIYFLTYMSISYLPVFLTTVVDLSPGTVGWLAAVAIALGMFTVPLSGYLVDRFSGKIVVTTSLIAAAVLLLPTLQVMGAAGASLLMIGVLWAIFQSITSSGATAGFATFVSYFPARVRYTGTAIGYNVGNAIGGGFGPLIAASLIAWTGDSRSLLLLAALAATLGVVVAQFAQRWIAQSPSAEPHPPAHAHRQPAVGGADSPDFAEETSTSKPANSRN